MRGFAASVLLLFVLSLTACSVQRAEQDYAQVHCPACIYTFDSPRE